MSDYQSILDKAAELYAMLDALAETRLYQHREAEALALYNAKLGIQKLLGVPPQIVSIEVSPPPPPDPEITPISIIGNIPQGKTGKKPSSPQRRKR